MTQQLSETAAAPPLGRHAAVVLALTSAVVFMVFLDVTIVNVAFETISRDLHAGASRLAWVLNAYSLTFAALVVPTALALLLVEVPPMRRPIAVATQAAMRRPPPWARRPVRSSSSTAAGGGCFWSTCRSECW
jgi:MFS family permease